jgi:ATP-dependent Clp protease protease subunit
MIIIGKIMDKLDSLRIVLVGIIIGLLFTAGAIKYNQNYSSVVNKVDKIEKVSLSEPSEKPEFPNVYVKENVVFLYGQVTASTVTELSIAFSQINSDDKYKDMLLVIDSPGGSAIGMLEIVSNMLESKKPIDTYVNGMAASAASLIFSAGVHRTASPASVIMTHEAKMMVADYVDASKAGNYKGTLDALNNGMKELLVKFTHQTLDYVNQNLVISGVDTFITPTDAVKHGLADEVGIIKVSR